MNDFSLFSHWHCVSSFWNYSKWQGKFLQNHMFENVLITSNVMKWHVTSWLFTKLDDYLLFIIYMVEWSLHNKDLRFLLIHYKLIRGIRKSNFFWITKYYFSPNFVYFFFNSSKPVVIVKIFVDWPIRNLFSQQKEKTDRIFGDSRNFGGLDATNELNSWKRFFFIHWIM